MTRYYVKAWEVIGTTWNGSAYCLEHSPNPDTVNIYGELPQPVFASDDLRLTDPDNGETSPYPCDTCGQPIEP